MNQWVELQEHSRCAFHSRLYDCLNRAGIRRTVRLWLKERFGFSEDLGFGPINDPFVRPSHWKFTKGDRVTLSLVRKKPGPICVELQTSAPNTCNLNVNVTASKDFFSDQLPPKTQSILFTGMWNREKQANPTLNVWNREPRISTDGKYLSAGRSSSLIQTNSSSPVRFTAVLLSKIFP